MKSLDTVLEELNQDEQETVNQPFIVNDLETAAEAQRRIAYFQDEMKKIDTITEQQIEPFKKKIERIEEWGEQSKQELIDKQSSYEALLEVYLRNEISKQIQSGKKPKKTLKLPYGKITLKKQQPEYTKDEVTLMEYAKQIGKIRVKESIDWENIKKNCQVQGGYLVDGNGEIVPGVTVTERNDKFEIKLDE